MIDWFKREYLRAPGLYLSLGILLAAFIAYGNSFQAGFHFDDAHHIVENPYVPDLSNAGAFFFRPDMFSAMQGHDMYRPLVMLSFALDCAAFGFEPLGWRLTAITLHGLCAVGIFVAIRRMLGGERKRVDGVAAVSAVLFAVHPLFSETVLYASARSTLLATTGFVWAFVAHRAAWSRGPGVARAALVGASLLLFAAALLSKETAIVLPALLLWCSIIDRRHYAAFVPAALVAAVYIYLRSQVLETTVIDFAARSGGNLDAAAHTGAARSIAWNLFTQARVIAAYIGMFLVPRGLCIDHTVRISTSVWELPVILGGLLILALLVIAWRVRRTHPIVSIGIVWFFFALAPTSSVIPLNQVMAERRMYLPGAGLMLVVAGLLWLVRPRRETLARFAGVAVLFALAALTQRRGADWRDSLRLWSATVEESPESARAWSALGAQLKAADRDEEAGEAYLKAIQLQHDLWDAHFNLGLLHFEYAEDPGRDRASELAQARAWFERSLERLPDSQKSLWLLARVLYHQLELLPAERIFLRLAPQDPRFYQGSRIYLGWIALLTGRLDPAERYFDEAMEWRSDRLRALLGKSAVAERRGDKKKAIEITRRTLKSHGSSPLPWVRMAELHAGTAAAEGYLHQATLRGHEVTEAQRAALLPR